MKPTVVVLLAAVALVGATGAVGAADGQSARTVEATERPDGQTETPPWPGDETTSGDDNPGDDTSRDNSSEDDSPGSDSPAEDDSSGEGDSPDGDTPGGADIPGDTPDSDTPEDDTPERETTSVSPGQQLAGAVGAQGASVQGELWNRTLSERLSNATTPGERAEVVADEVETIEAYLDALEAVRANVTGAWEDGEISEGEYRASLSEFVVRAYSVERRANQTVRAAERLPQGVRERNDINVTHVRNLAEQAHALYQFEEPIAQEVANETLSNQSALKEVLPEGARTDQNQTRTGQ